MNLNNVNTFQSSLTLGSFYNSFISEAVDECIQRTMKDEDKMSTARTIEQATAMENFDDDEEERDDDLLSLSHSGSSMRSSDGLSAPNHNIESDDDLKQVQEFARNEDRRVVYSRALVAFAILAVGALVSSLTYVILHAQVLTNSSNAVSLSVHTRSENLLTRRRLALPAHYARP